MNFDSIILSWAFVLWQKLKTLYYNSITALILKKLSEYWKAVLSGSWLWSCLKKESIFSRGWEHSVFFRLLNWLFNAPLRACGRVYNKYEHIFLDSYSFKLLRIILNRFEFLIGIALVVIFVTPHKYWNNTYSVAAVFLLILLYAIKAAYSRDEYFNIKALTFALLLFMAAVSMSLLTSVLPKDSVRFLIFYLTCFFLVLVIISAVKTGYSLNLLLKLLSVGIAATGLYGIWQSIIGLPIDVAQVDSRIASNLVGRIYSTVENPNNYAEVLVLTMPFMIAVILNSKRVMDKAKYAFLLAISVIALLLTGSRTGMAVFAGSILIFVFLKNRKLIPLAVILGILCFPLLPPSIINRIMTIGNAANDTSISYRGDIYKTVFPMFKDFWATGIGLGTDAFRLIIQHYYLGWTKNTVPPHTHNLYLQIWIEMGFAGIITFLWFIVRTVKNSLLNIYSKTDMYVNNILIAGVSSMAGITVMGIAEHIWFYPRVMLMYWINLGIILAALNISSKHKGYQGTI